VRWVVKYVSEQLAIVRLELSFGNIDTNSGAFDVYDCTPTQSCFEESVAADNDERIRGRRSSYCHFFSAGLSLG
jgi:hypothetical protein